MRCEIRVLEYNSATLIHITSHIIPKQVNIFLPGASGFVGQRVLNDLLSAGHTVTALVHSARSKSRLASHYPGLSIAPGDVSHADEILRALPAGTEAVVYLPGLLREFPNKGITFRKVHVEGVQNVLSAAKQQGVRRWIELSALGAGPNPSTAYYRTKLEAEELVRSSGLDWTILRPSLIFDDRPRSEHNFVGEVARAIRIAPFIPILGSGAFRLQPISLDDVSQAIVQALAEPETFGNIYKLGGPETLTYREVVLWIADAMGSKKAAIQIPLWEILAMARRLDRFTWFPISTDEITMLRNGNYVHDPADNQKVRETFDLPMKRFSDCIGLALKK